MREDFIRFKQYYQESANKVPQNEFYHGSIMHKFKHSVEVLHIGQKIMAETPELKDRTNEFTVLAEKALLFHDVGRFEEAVKRCEAEKKGILVKASSNQYDHCEIGYNELKDVADYNDLRVLFAVRYHGKMIEDAFASDMWQEVLKSPNKDDALKILYLVRDADKMANLYVIKNDNHLCKDVFYKQLTKEALNAPISPVVMEQFFQKKVVLFPTIYSFADAILRVISWIFDLNYQKTKEIFVNRGYGDYLLNELAKYHENAKDIEEIRKVVNSNLGGK